MCTILYHIWYPGVMLCFSFLTWCFALCNIVFQFYLSAGFIIDGKNRQGPFTTACLDLCRFVDLCFWIHRTIWWTKCQHVTAYCFGWQEVQRCCFRFSKNKEYPLKSQVLSSFPMFFPLATLARSPRKRNDLHLKGFKRQVLGGHQHPSGLQRN